MPGLAYTMAGHYWLLGGFGAMDGHNNVCFSDADHKTFIPKQCFPGA